MTAQGGHDAAEGVDLYAALPIDAETLTRLLRAIATEFPDATARGEDGSLVIRTEGWASQGGRDAAEGVER